MEEEPSIVRILEDDIPELRFRLGALETELGLMGGENSQDDDDDDSDDWSVPAPPNFCARCCHCIRRSITVPFIFLVSVLVAVCVIIFCIFPASIVMVIVVALYYCCARDPIPFRVLLTAMLGSDGAGDADSPPTKTVPEIHAAVIKRRCHGPYVTTEKIQDDQLLMDLDDGTRLLFSKPLAEDEIEDSADAAPTYLLPLAPWQLGEEPEAKQADDSLADVDESESAVKLNSEEEHIDDDAPKLVKEEGDVEKGGTVEPQADAEVTSDQEEDSSTNESPEKAPGLTGDIEMNCLPADPTGEPMRDDCDQQRVTTQDDSESHSCDICLLPFEKGQIVAWSHNSQCEHAYHLDCITDWLIKKKSCPNCRADYMRKM